LIQKTKEFPLLIESSSNHNHIKSEI